MSDDSGDDSSFVVSDDDLPVKPKKKEAAAAKPRAPPKKKKKDDDDTGDMNVSVLSERDAAVFTNIDKQTKKLNIEDIYQKKTQLEHILLRPDTYIGSVEYTERSPMWVYDAESEKLVLREISYVPGLYKIFDEILVNAADNKQRDPKMNVIRVDINKAANKISVFNNGKGIPVALHKVEQLYVPEMIFGTLLTSSNYDDSERKVTGGRNGYGAKLCNIFSTEFILETSSKEYKKCFKQTWINNMTKDKDPIVDKATGDDFTKITFKPDLAKFKMKELDDDIIALMSRRAYDVAGSVRGVKVYLNGRQLPVNGFKSYVEQYTKEATDSHGEPLKVVYEQVNDRWEVALTVSDKGFQQVSFVNSIATSKGGRHVDYVADQIVSKLIETIKKKVGKSSVNVKPFQVKNHIWVFVNALIENPTFDSQTKETMTLQSKSFGSKCEPSEKFMKAAQSCGVVDSVVSWVHFRQQELMDKKCSSKKTSKLKGVPKLEDANDAGTKNSLQCTLILTEGDSAKSLAVSGLGVVGRDRYGVFPLRGKLLNVRDGNPKQVAENAEITALIKILGLQYKKKYDTDDDMKSLRYGKVMVMADQDQDGSHIKGLVINFIHHNWPSLIRRNFVEEFITPIVKATKGNTVLSFFSIPEYNEWRANTDNWKTYRIKYYKGLGTSTSKEAKEYFSDMARHRIRFKYRDQADDMALVMAFSKKKIEERKDWLTKWMAEKKERRAQGLQEEYLYNKDTRHVSFAEFVNKELVLFSNTDNERSIPSLVDGLKPGQRKVMFACFKRADKREVKVAQLAGAVGELSAYHHGEQSLMSTIVNLAQDFVGSNNVNLLLPIGQFGTRLQGGNDSASPRYIFTQLNPVTRYIFPAVDDNVLRFLFEENQRIEPDWYCPIIPMVLINGASGIGTGWSTKVPNYNPRDVVENVRRLIRGEELRPMKPWFKHFKGEIQTVDAQHFMCFGEVALIDDNTIEITELPIRVWTQNYKEQVIEPFMESTDKNDFKEYHTDQTVRFVVKIAPERMREIEGIGIHKVFKLQCNLSTTSMVLFDAAGCLRKFDTPEDICKEFFEVRKQKYIERKSFLVGMLRAQSKRLSNQARFILAKIKGEILLENKKKAVIIDQLIKKNFDPDPVKRWKDEQKKKEQEASGEVELEEEEDTNSENGDEANKDKTLEARLGDYDYLVGMALIKLSEEEKDKLLKESEVKLEEVRLLEAKEWSDLWTDDLDEFLVQLEKQEQRELNDIDTAIKNTLKKFVKDAPVKGKKNTSFSAEVFASKDGIRVEPKLDEATKAKYEKDGEPKKKREPRVPKEKKPKKSEGQDVRKFFSPNGDSKKSKKKKKEDTWESGGSESELDNVSEGSFDFIDNDDDDDVGEVEKVKVTKTTAADRKKRAEKRVSDESLKENKGKGDDEGDPWEIDGEDTPPKTKAAKKEAPKKFDEGDDKPAASKKPPVVELSDDDDDEKPKKAKTVEKKETAPKPKKEAPKKETNKKVTDFFSKKSKDSDSDDSFNISDSPPPARTRPGRAAAISKKTYAELGEDSDEEEYVPKKKNRIVDSDSD